MIKFIRRGTILSFLFSFSTLVSAQTNYQVSVMSWNLLNFPDQSALAADTTDRCPAYRSVMQYAQPDILVTVENTSANGASIILSNVMNTYGKHYAEGTFINGYDTDNAIYYRDSIFQFISNVPISTPLRDISHFTLKFIPTGDTLHIFAAHLKAGLGYESDRAVEVTLLRQVTDAFPAGTNFLAAGDFNIYTTTEPCYQDFLYNSGTNEGYFLDPISVTGTYNNSAYSNYHTQSTRLTSIGGGAGGGLDDRFDMILHSKGVHDPGGIYFLSSSYHPIGNDGNHYNQSVNNGTNAAVPTDVANALYTASDHLPVILSLEIGLTSGMEYPDEEVTSMHIFPNPAEQNCYVEFSLKKTSELKFALSDPMGRLCLASEKMKFEAGKSVYEVLFPESLPEGLYFLTISGETLQKSIPVMLVR